MGRKAKEKSFYIKKFMQGHRFELDSCTAMSNVIITVHEQFFSFSLELLLKFSKTLHHMRDPHFQKGHILTSAPQ